MAEAKTKKQKIVVTSALPYANGPIHIGHLVEYIQTDIFVRFLKLTGKDAIYCCADDTHGTPIEIKASSLGIKPEELIAQVYKEHVEDFSGFQIRFDSYYTTNSPENKHFADKIFLALKAKGLIYTKEIENFFDLKANRFLPDRYVKGECPKCGEKDQYGDVCEKCNATYKPIDLINPYSTLTKEQPVLKKSMHYFFKLSEYSERLDKWLTENKSLQPEIVNYVRNWIKEGLSDWDISRDGPYFGFNIPGEKNKFYYVWLDAPIGYIASTANFCSHSVENADKEYWMSKNSKIMHFIGKDIIYFHFLFWPAMLMGSGYNLPDTIAVHGFLTVNGEKMSKSRGTFYTAKEFLQKYKPEHLRYYYASMLGSRLSDIDLNFDELKSKVNNELVANIGNFCYRVISFTQKNFNGEIKKIDNNLEIIELINEKIKSIENNYNKLNYNETVKDILYISSVGNKYFQDNEPWKLINTDRERVQKILGLALNIVKNLCILINPILPVISKELEEQLNLKDLAWKDLDFKLKDHKLGKEKILISKIEDSPGSGNQEKIEEKFPLNLKVAKILEVNDHPNADKLYVLKLDLKSKVVQIVSGLRGHYSKEELTGKKIILLSNLKKAKLRGVESHGMLLAGDSGTDVGILLAENSGPGDDVMFGNMKNSEKEVSYDEFSKIEIVFKDDKICYDNKILRTDSEEIALDKREKFSNGTRIK